MKVWALTQGSPQLPNESIVEVDVNPSPKGQAKWGLDEFIQAPATMPVWVKTEKKCYLLLKGYLKDFWIS